MITLVGSMLRARRVQAVTVFLLSAVASAAAVAGPVALTAVDDAVIRNELAQASVQDRSLSTSEVADPSDAEAAERFDTTANLLTLNGFDMIRGGELTAFPLVSPGQPQSKKDSVRMVFRDSMCAHVVITSGRCVAGTSEALIDEATARKIGVGAGQVATAQASFFDPVTGIELPDGPATPVTVVGIYRPRDPDEVYWGAHDYFPPTVGGGRTYPVLVNLPTFDLIGHQHGDSVADSIARPVVFSPSRLDGLKHDVEQVVSEGAGNGGGLVLSTTIPDLVDRIQAGRELAGHLVPVAFVPLVGLCWYVVYLTVGYGLTGRRHELALASLRGVGRVRRWWLANGETLAAILAGAPVGYFLGYAVIGLVARARFGITVDVEPSLATVAYAAVALSGALAVAVAGQWRVFASPVVDLLRGVPRRSTGWRSFAAEGVIVAFAALGVAQLQAGSGDVVGVGLLVPGLVVTAVAVLTARLFTPAAGVIARAALRRGRLGSGLAAIQIARRPGSQRLFVLLAAAFGLLTFVAIAGSVASLGRDERSSILSGAPMVAIVDRSTGDRLLTATHAADPGGSWAMAARPVTQRDTTAPPVWAVDSPRLAATASWQSGYGLSAPAVAAALRPPATQPIVLRHNEFTADLARDGSGDPDATVVFVFRSIVDGTVVLAPVTLPERARSQYRVAADGCAPGCRLTGITIDGGPSATVTVRLYGLNTPDGPLVSPADTGVAGRWAPSPAAQVTPYVDGLQIVSRPTAFTSPMTSVAVVDAPLPVPVVSTQAGLPSMTGLDGTQLDLHPPVLAAKLLPRLGSDGTLVDLSYLQAVSVAVLADTGGEVWIGPQAPPDAVARLRAAGLAITTVRSASAEHAELANSGPALALRFQLAAAGFGILLALGGFGLVAAVDRRRRAADLRALRQQGLPRRFVARATLWGYLSLVAGSAVAGLLAASIAWYLTGPSLPFFAQTLSQLPPPRWPQPGAVVWPWAVATLALLAGAFIASWTLRAAVSEPSTTKRG